MNGTRARALALLACAAFALAPPSRRLARRQPARRRATAPATTPPSRAAPRPRGGGDDGGGRPSRRSTEPPAARRSPSRRTASARSSTSPRPATSRSTCGGSATSRRRASSGGWTRWWRRSRPSTRTSPSSRRCTRRTPGSRRRRPRASPRAVPDIWYNWAGTWSLSPAWKGCTVPNEDVLDASDIAANPYDAGDAVRGQDLALPALPLRLPDGLQQGPVSAAGLDPEAPPTTLEELIAGLEALKDSGVTPFALGLKDGFGGEIIAAGQLEKQWVNAPQDVMQKVDRRRPAGPGVAAVDREVLRYEAVLQRGRQLARLRRRPGAVPDRQGGDGRRRARRAVGDLGDAGGGQERRRVPQDAGVRRRPWAKSVSNTGNGFQVRCARSDTEGRRARSWPSCSAREPGQACTRRPATSRPARTGTRRASRARPTSSCWSGSGEKTRPGGSPTTRRSTSTSTARSSSGRR